LLAALPVVGAVLYAATLKRTRRELADVVRSMAIQRHRRWIMETMRLPHGIYHFSAPQQLQERQEGQEEQEEQEEQEGQEKQQAQEGQEGQQAQEGQ
jgi:hypothetical protein